MQVTDLHSHVLPGVDDGSKDPDMTREMLRVCRESGVDRMVATPHFYGRRSSLEHFLEKRARALETVRQIPADERPEILWGAEVAFYSGLTRENDLAQLCVAGTRTLLLEMPFGIWTDFEVNEVASICFDRGLTVVIAHLERYEGIAPKQLMEQLLRLPVHVQINAETLIPWRGRRPWLQMFREGRAELLGSDCHDLTRRAPNLAEAREVLRRKLGESVLRRIDKDSDALLAGAERI